MLKYTCCGALQLVLSGNSSPCRHLTLLHVLGVALLRGNDSPLIAIATLILVHGLGFFLLDFLAPEVLDFIALAH